MKKIWVEEYRPKTINDVIFQDEQQEQKFRSFVKNGEIPNLLLSGVQGTGKTTISGVLINELKIDSSDVLRINCSDEKIEAIRNKVSDFAWSMPIGNFRLVQLEEFDFLSLDAQGLLRGLIEDTSSNCRFIATCNYENRIIPPLKSRLQHFHFKNPNKDEIILRMATILENENIEFDVEDLSLYVDIGYPDIRRTIQLLESNSHNGHLCPPQNTDSNADWKFGLIDHIINCDLTAARKLVCNSSQKEEHEGVFTFLYQNIDKFPPNKQEQVILIIAEFATKHLQIADTELNLAACFIEIGMALQ